MTVEPPRVRQATPDDRDEVFGLACEMAITFVPRRDAFDVSFEAVLHMSDAHLLVVELDGRVAGYLLGFEHPAFFANGPVAWVEEIAVREDLRRGGLGSWLMSAFEDRVRAGGSRLVALATTRAGPFYESLGYRDHAVYFRRSLDEGARQ